MTYSYKLIFTLLCMGGMALPLTAQADATSYISWSSTRKLSWNDFKAPVPAATRVASASTATGMHFNYSVNGDSIAYELEVYFNPAKSWVKDKTPLILAHEQGHFDIAEIYIRKLYKALKEYKFNKHSYKKALRNIYQRIVREKDDFQNQYDNATQHSINAEQQKIWEDKIKNILMELEAYANYPVVNF